MAMQSTTLSATVPLSMQQYRLDAALRLLYPKMGLRGRRRLWETNQILCNGRNCKPGHLVTGGDTLTVVPLLVHDEQRVQKEEKILYAQVALLCYEAPFAIVSKPAALHTVQLAGIDSPSVEAILPSCMPVLHTTINQAAQAGLLPKPELLTRLDKDTSGMLVATTHAGGQSLFRKLEDACRVEKYYYALVCGVLANSLVCTQQLDTANRQKTAVLDAQAPLARHTHIQALQTLDIPDFQTCTLVQALIYKGARHQIRAHLAHAGFPLVGDTVYGDPASNLPLHLHHWRCVIPFDNHFAYAEDAETVPNLDCRMPLPQNVEHYLWHFFDSEFLHR